MKNSPIHKNGILFWIGIITAIWFLWSGMVWTYAACLVIGYPFGLISLFIWLRIRKNGEKRNQIIPLILLLGFLLSLLVLIYFLIVD
jgi:hypothetical protein